MGSKGLWAFIRPIIKRIPLANLKNKRLIIDIILYLHKQIIGIRNKGHDIINNRGKNINHLVSLYHILKNLINVDILPICVFDGKPPELKKQTITKRKAITEKSKQLVSLISNEINKLNDDWEEINSSDSDVIKPDMHYISNEEYDNDNIEDTDYGTKLNIEYLKHFKKSYNINTSQINDCKSMLEMMGLPVITSIEEADKDSVNIYNRLKTYIAGILTEDSDILLYGGECIYKDIDFATGTISEINISDVLKYLQNKARKIDPNIIFTFQNLIDFSIILGNDYTAGIRTNSVIEQIEEVDKSISNLSNSREIIFRKFIKSNCNVPELIDTLYNFNEQNQVIIYYIPANFKETYLAVRNIYTSNANDTYTIQNIIMSQPDLVKLQKYLLDNDIIKRYSANIFMKNLTKLYEAFKIKRKYQIIHQQPILEYSCRTTSTSSNESSPISDSPTSELSPSDIDNNGWTLVTKHKCKLIYT